MDLDLRLAPQVVQRVALGVELRQGLQILQLPVLDLEMRIWEELGDNPALEIEEPNPVSGEPPATDDRWPSERLAALVEALTAGPDVRTGTGDAEEDGDGDPFRHIAHPGPTLRDALREQLASFRLSPAEARAADFLVDCLDDNGYLTVDVSEASRVTGLPLPALEAGLRAVQRCEPPGVGARDLAECLLLQWRARGGGEGLVTELIRHHLPALARGHQRSLARRLGVTVDAVQQAVRWIRRLDPKPGRSQTGQPVMPVVPDVFAVVTPSGTLEVAVNESPLPRLTISPVFRRLLREPDLSPYERAFVESRVQRATALLRNIQRRRRTLERVTEAILRLQRPFVDGGIRHLRSLTLAEVAAEVGLHVSTVSRAVAGKYVQTPRGALALRSFFTSGVVGPAGSLSASSLKEQIREILSQERPGEALTDRMVVEILARRGVRIARRTVAKYRREVGIPAGAMRRGWTG